ncbi:hypothetical protein LTR95_002455 [Oleoguttula sp. CCFEE 5521]
MSSSYDNIFQKAANRTPGYVEVTMDNVQMVTVGLGQNGAIATRRLGGCSGLVILGENAAMMAHIAPRPRNAPKGQSAVEAHFKTYLEQVARMYWDNRQWFPAASTAWGFYVAGFNIITDTIKEMAVRCFTRLGLSNQHTYYSPNLSPERRDEVRACVLLAPGKTLFVIEAQKLAEIEFPLHLPDRTASRARSQNFLEWGGDRVVQSYYGAKVAIDNTRLNGVYDVLCGKDWQKYDFTSRKWLDPRLR